MFASPRFRCALFIWAGYIAGAADTVISNRLCRADDPPAKSKSAETHYTPEQQAKLDHAVELQKHMMELHGQGKYAEAEKLAQQALEINEAILGLDHPDVASALSNLDSMYQAQGKYSQAEPFCSGL